jgi:hypothetical protein
MNDEPIYADASRSAVLSHGVYSVNFRTLREAVLEFAKLPDERQSLATIVSVRRTYSAAEIRRLRFGPIPGDGAPEASTIPVDDLNASNDA